MEIWINKRLYQYQIDYIMEKQKRKRLLRWLLFAGFVTGSIDALMTIVTNSKIPPEIIFKYIASGVFGKLAFSPGSEMVIYGVLFHYWIAFAWTVLFFLLYRQLIHLLRYRILFIPITGLIIWAVMNLAIVPLSQASASPMHLIGILKNIAILIFAFGLPITVIADRYYSSASETGQTYEAFKTS